VALTTIDDKAWRGLAPLLGLAPNDNARLTDRRRHASELTGHLSRWISQRERDDAVALLREHGQDAAPVLSMHERRSAEIFAARHADAHILLGNGSQVQIPLQPWLVGSLERTGDDWRAPDFGADTVEIAREILKTPARDIKRLIAAGVLGVPAATATSRAKG
jgi:crotonobetainyl-CoA:carnitine CoA-transferase CaiB-like acyl-CoA transferase